MQADSLIKEVEQFSSSNLSRKDDLTNVISLVLDNLNEKVLEDLTFDAKYLMGLRRVMEAAAGNPEVQNKDKIKSDFAEAIKEINQQLYTIIEFAEKSYKDYFTKEYLESTMQSIINLNLLVQDLEWVKKYFNYKKRLN